MLNRHRERQPAPAHGALMKLILVCGPFGSGTSAVAGLSARLGAVGFGPYYQPADERTPDSHELIAFRDLMLTLASEETTKLLPGADVKTALEKFCDRIANQELGAYAGNAKIPIFLKHPLAALIIPQICAAFETRLIYLLRPIRGIEASRRRRRRALLTALLPSSPSARSHASSTAYHSARFDGVNLR
jgi:hypothetical protein